MPLLCPFQKTASVSVTTLTWPQGLSPLPNVTGSKRGTEYLGKEQGVCSWRGKGEPAERCGQHSFAWACLTLLPPSQRTADHSGLQKGTEMGDIKTIGKNSTAGTQ